MIYIFTQFIVFNQNFSSVKTIWIRNLIRVEAEMSYRRNARTKETETACNLCGLHHESVLSQRGSKKRQKAPAMVKSRNRRSPLRRQARRVMSLGDLPNGCSVHSTPSNETVGSDNESSMNLNHLKRQVLEYIVDEKPAKRSRKSRR